MKAQSESQRYAAFISYRHLSPDKEIAQALHKLLEHNMVRPNRKVPRNIRPVFLDVYELPTLESLDRGIKDALDRSDCLFVVCSPNLPLSTYCMAEIAYFKEIHHGSTDRIYTILADGEPGEAFPELLRTKTIRTTLPDGSQREETVPTEPLFADVRGKTITHSLWKLIKSEYLRLAAAYYRCSYSQLHKRYLRWLLALGIYAAIFLGLIGYGFHLNRQILQTETITSHAQQLVEREEELLAITLCQDGTYTHSQRYQSALRSAVIQYDYKLHAQPVGPVSLANIVRDSKPIRYLSADGNQIITLAGSMLQITDTASGAILLQEPQDQVFVTANQPSTYLKLHSHKNELGIMQDYVSLHRLEDNSFIREFAYRDSDRYSSACRLLKLIQTDAVLAIASGDEIVAYLTSDGQQLTEEAYHEIGMQHLNDPLLEDNQPFYIALDKLRKVYCVRNQEGALCLSLGKTVSAYVCSPDATRFAWSDGETIWVYDTTEWTLLGTLEVEDHVPQLLYLPDHTSYCFSSRLEDGTLRSTVFDCQTGNQLLHFAGDPLFHPSQPLFFVTEQGKITRYHYQDLDYGEAATVIAHVENRCLLRGDDVLRLLDTSSGRILMELPCSRFDKVQYNASLEKWMLINAQRITCYSPDGLLWEKETTSKCGAISPCGTLAVWADSSGNLCIADAQTGTMLRQVPASSYETAGPLLSLTVSPLGLGISGENGTLWIPDDGRDPVLFEGYGEASLYEDGTLVLEDPYARVLDFQVYDTHTDIQLLQPENNTGNWSYSPKSKYLIRHIETSGNHPTMMIEVLQRKGSRFTVRGTISLDSGLVGRLQLDSSGEWISVLTGDGSTLVFQTDSLEKWLDVNCRLYYEDGNLYSDTAYGSRQYQIPMYPIGQLQTYSQDTLSANSGIRKLTKEERMQYGISFE